MPEGVGRHGRASAGNGEGRRRWLAAQPGGELGRSSRHCNRDFSASFGRKRWWNMRIAAYQNMVSMSAVRTDAHSPAVRVRHAWTVSACPVSLIPLARGALPHQSLPRLTLTAPPQVLPGCRQPPLVHTAGCAVSPSRPTHPAADQWRRLPHCADLASPTQPPRPPGQPVDVPTTTDRAPCRLATFSAQALVWRVRPAHRARRCSDGHGGLARRSSWTAPSGVHPHPVGVPGQRRVHRRVARGRGQLAAAQRNWGAAARSRRCRPASSPAIWGMEQLAAALAQLSARWVALQWHTLARTKGAAAPGRRPRLLAALCIIEPGERRRRRMIGSWAGAMGTARFLPSVFLAYAVDADGDGHRDIWGSVPDVTASTAHFSRRSGWKSGDPGELKCSCPHLRPRPPTPCARPQPSGDRRGCSPSTGCRFARPGGASVITCGRAGPGVSSQQQLSHHPLQQLGQPRWAWPCSPADQAATQWPPLFTGIEPLSRAQLEPCKALNHKASAARHPNRRDKIAPAWSHQLLSNGRGVPTGIRRWSCCRSCFRP